jgi:acetyltransferase-like isoleucine patch superfamily enzyme
MGLEDFITRIRRAETPFYARLNRMAKGVRSFEAPVIPPWHGFLYREHQFRYHLWRDFWRVMYYQPMFRTRCDSCGKGLYLFHSGQGIPYLIGDLSITIGENVKLYDHVALAGLTVGERSRLVIGDNTEIPTSISIFVANEVAIGSNCLIVSSFIADNPGHTMNYDTRLNERVETERVGRVRIGDYAWAAHSSMIIGNVDVGEGAVIAAGAVVTKDVPPFCVVAGNPARLVKKLPFPVEMRERLSEEAYRRYEEAEIRR